MHAGQTALLSQKVSEQAHGIVLHWQGFNNGTTQGYNHCYYFVPKSHVHYANGQGIGMFMSNNDGNTITTKYVYVNDDSVVGNNVNSRAKTTMSGSSINVTPNEWVLTQIIGV